MAVCFLLRFREKRQGFTADSGLGGQNGHHLISPKRDIF
jgi:hypothetical protein